VIIIITLMMEAESTSETSVNVYQTTQRNNPEDSNLHTRRRENLMFHIYLLLCIKSVGKSGGKRSLDLEDLGVDGKLILK
jgi:hypothetical protein